MIIKSANTGIRIIISMLLASVLCSCRSPVENQAKTDTVKTSSAKIIPGGPSGLYGIDISAYQGDEIDLLNNKQDTLSFIICRATLGVTVTDPDFKNNWTLIPQKGFIRGAYHFYECSDDPKQQAQHFLSVIGSLSANDFPPILDFEQAGLAGVTNVQQIQNDLLIFLSEVETTTGRTPVIYVSPDFADIYLNNNAFAKYPLYVADYDGLNQPQIPATWKSAGWKFWQKNDSVKVNGTINDFDEFNGNQQAMQSFIHQ